MSGGEIIDAGRLAPMLEVPGPVVSLYVPLTPEQRDLRAPEVRLRQALEQADRLLATQLPDAARRDGLLAPARAVLEGNLAEHRDPGLAILMAEGRSDVIALPEPPEALVVVGQHAHIKPLLPLLARNRRFHILALSAGQARLLTATPYIWQERPLTALPPDAQAELDARPAASAETREQARMALLVQDPHRVAHAVAAALGDDPAPILLAAEPQVAGRFMQAAPLPQLLAQTVAVNPFALSDAALHARAVAIMRPLIDAELAAVLEQVDARLNAGQPPVSIRLEEILAAAEEGRVDTVVVAADEALWGRYRPGQKPDAHGHEVPGDEDLVNLAAVTALRTGARAYAIPRERLPLHAPAVATLRF